MSSLCACHSEVSFRTIEFRVMLSPWWRRGFAGLHACSLNHRLGEHGWEPCFKLIGGAKPRQYTHLYENTHVQKSAKGPLLAPGHCSQLRPFTIRVTHQPTGGVYLTWIRTISICVRTDIIQGSVRSGWTSCTDGLLLEAAYIQLRLRASVGDI